MANPSTALEEFDIIFNPEEFGDEAQKVTDKLMVYLDFLKKDVLPKVESFVLENPTLHEIQQMELKRESDVLHMNKLKGDFNKFTDELAFDLSNYKLNLEQDLYTNLSYTGFTKVREILKDKISEKILTPLYEIYHALEEKLNDFTERGFEIEETDSPLERGVNEAGKRRQMPVDQFMRENS